MSKMLTDPRVFADVAAVVASGLASNPAFTAAVSLASPNSVIDQARMVANTAIAYTHMLADGLDQFFETDVWRNRVTPKQE